jgi:hypothetical protein
MVVRRVGIGGLLAALLLETGGVAVADSPPAPVPTIVATHLLDDLPLPLPADARPRSATLGFRMGGISDLVALPGPGESVQFWAVTDRGPNGLVPKPGSTATPADMLRTLPVAEFVPLICRLEMLPAAAGNPLGRVGVAEIKTVTTSRGPTSGRPAVGPPRSKKMVDPATAEPLPVDPDGIDSEGLAPAAGGGFWVAEEYGPSLLLLDAEGQAVRRLMPEGVALDGAGCEVVDCLPAVCALRQDNRGFESLAVSPDGSLLFTMLQSPPDLGPQAAAEDRVTVPLLVLDAAAGKPLRTLAYRLGDPDDAIDDLLAADGKISAIAPLDGERLLVLEQSSTSSRIYSVDTTSKEDPLPKTLVADLASLAPRFAADITPGAPGAPAKLSDLKFEGLALPGPGLVALINDNAFDMDAQGAAAAVPPIRRTCLWILRLDQARR